MVLATNYLNNRKGSDSTLYKLWSNFKEDGAGVSVPSVNKIISFQKKTFKDTFTNSNLRNDPKLKLLNNDLQSSINGTQIGDFKEYLVKIQEYVRNINNLSYQTKNDNAEINYQKANQLLAEAKTFFINLAVFNDLKEVQFALSKLLTRIDELQSMITYKNPDSSSLLKSIAWVEYHLKGEFLEAKGLEYFQDVIPKDFKVLATGSLRGQYDILGNYKSGVKMKEDFMILKNSNFKIQYKIGKNGITREQTFDEFLKYLEGKTSKTSIFITEEGYNTLKQNLVAGVSAKASLSENIKFGTLNVLTNHETSEGVFLAKLKEIYNKSAIFQNEHQDYDALFNYNLGQYITHIVGNTNKILLTAEGIVDMKHYILSLFEKGSYFYGKNFKLSGRSATKVQINKT